MLKFIFRTVAAPIRAVVSLVVIAVVAYFAFNNWGQLENIWNQAKPYVDEAYALAKPYVDSVLAQLGDSDDYYKVAGKAEVSAHARGLKPGEVNYLGYDSLGRVLGVEALLDASNIEYGKRPRGDINQFRPSGWYKNEEVEIKFSDGSIYRGWFYNRSHLLAHSLGGEDDALNLITGTRMQNVGKNDGKGGMQYAESLVRDYIEKNPDVSVYYIVTPYYEKDELVARYILVDIKSTDGGIDKRIKVVNTAKGFEIDYNTGEFRKVQE